MSGATTPTPGAQADAAEDADTAVNFTPTSRPHFDNGLHFLGVMDGSSVGLELVFTFFDPRIGRLVWTLPCGCSVTAPVTGVLRQLAQIQAAGHVSATDLH